MVFQQEGIDSSPVEGHQCLNQMVTVQDGMVIGSREFIECFYPDVCREVQPPIIQSCNALDLCVSSRLENGLQYGC